jgi:hypothetical protein
MPEQCDYYWADFDRCQKIKNHEGAHSMTAPQCGEIMSGTEYACDDSMWHSGFHKVTLRWASLNESNTGEPNA